MALRGSSRPAVLVGVEVQRYGIAREVSALITQLGVPWASTLLGKSALAEDTPGFVGVYAGTRALPNVKRVIEEGRSEEDVVLQPDDQIYVPQRLINM